MKILQVIGTLNPNYGGPVVTLLQQSKMLLKLGHQIEILTLDKGTDDWITSYPFPVYPIGPSFLKYRFNFSLIPWLMKNNSNYDVVIVRGIWQFHSFATWIAAQKTKSPYFVFVHGALDPWFKKEYPMKHLKKLVYWILFEYRVLRYAKGVLFTSEDEKILARQSFLKYSMNEIVVDYGICLPEEMDQECIEEYLSLFPVLRNKKVVLYLSRIHPKKGCDLLIKAFADIADIDPNTMLVFSGPDDSGWSSELKRLAKTLNISERILWTGMMLGKTKWAAIKSADLFVLPSHTENFGVVVVEALASSVPVLITNKMNIWREIQADHAGIVCADTVSGVRGGLKHWMELSPEKKDTMRRRAFECFSQRYDLEKTTEAFVGMLNTYIQ